jgi:hypothetical protein
VQELPHASWQSSAVARYLGLLCFKFSLCTRLYRCVCTKERSRWFVIIICTICRVISVRIVLPMNVFLNVRPFKRMNSSALETKEPCLSRNVDTFPLDSAASHRMTVIFIFTAVRTSDQHSFKAITIMPFILLCFLIWRVRVCMCVCILLYNALHSNILLASVNASSMRVSGHLLLKIWQEVFNWFLINL